MSDQYEPRSLSLADDNERLDLLQRIEELEADVQARDDIILEFVDWVGFAEKQIALWPECHELTERAYKLITP